MGKYFGEGQSRIKDPRDKAVSLLACIFRFKYKKYYGIECPNNSYKVRSEIIKSFELFELDIYNSNNREWYMRNVLEVIFERYDKLGYSEGGRFCAGHLHVDWLMYRLVNNIPRYK